MMNTSMKCVFPVVEVGEKCAELERHGFRLFSIETVYHSQHFFDQVIKYFPLDPVLSGRVHWDALVDSIYGGLDTCENDKLGLVIRNATTFKHRSEADFQIAIECLTSACQELVVVE